MNDISCQICQDLMPLVKDGVASEDSRDAVIRHVAECEACRKLFEEVGDLKPQMDEKRVLAKIKKQLAFTALVMVVLGAFIGLGFSDSSLVFYNILIMPTIGALGYFALREKSYLVPVAMFPFVYIWYMIKYWFMGVFGSAGLVGLFSAPLTWALIHAGLSATGTLVAFLLHFAFKKEDGTDAKIV